MPQQFLGLARYKWRKGPQKDLPIIFCFFSELAGTDGQLAIYDRIESISILIPVKSELMKDLIDEMLRCAKTIAVIGMSDKPWRASNHVGQYLAANGYRVIPVNPMLK